MEETIKNYCEAGFKTVSLFLFSQRLAFPLFLARVTVEARTLKINEAAQAPVSKMRKAPVILGCLQGTVGVR